MSQPAYFVDHKRGEVNELKALLRNIKVDRDPAKKREVVKKVIAYMTLGIDVSKIFSEMVMAASTKDLVQKKMVYQYLCSYAHQKANLALLVINTLQKDCGDEDPMVRGLALRSLSSLRVPNLVEYAMPFIRKALVDNSGYVRKTAVMAVDKLFRVFPNTIKDSDLVDILYNMLRDKDAMVVANALHTLNEVLASEGGMALNSAIVMHLLNRMRDFNEWQQCVLLDLVAHYTPASQNEMFDIMNLLEERLKHSNSAVVLGTTKIFLHFTRELPRVHEEVYKRLKAPLLTLASGGSNELNYVVLSHVKILVERQPAVFADAFKDFFCRFNDTVPVKKLKLAILTMLATEKNMSELINELAEYVSDSDSDLSRSAVAAIGKIALSLEPAADEAIEHLLSFLDLNHDYITAQTCIVVKDLLRKYPERYEEVIPAVQKCLKSVDDVDGKVAVLWMVGEYGESIPEAPYLLETLVSAYAEDDAATAVRMELLTSVMKLFFKRPPEMQKTLGRLLKMAVEDVNRVGVRDRALMFYRLLRLDVHEASRVVNCPKVIVDAFADSEDTELKERIFREFNSLSVVYELPRERFLDDAKNRDLGIVVSADFDTVEDPDKEEKEQAPAREALVSPSERAPSPAGPAPSQQQPVVDLLGMGDLGFGASSPSSAPKLAPQVFQAQWGSLPESGSKTFSLKQASTAVGPVIERSLAARHINTMASGTVNQTIKFYFYAMATDNSLLLVEALLELTSGQMHAKLKTQQAASQVEAFWNVMKDALAALL